MLHFLVRRGIGPLALSFPDHLVLFLHVSRITSTGKAAGMDRHVGRRLRLRETTDLCFASRLPMSTSFAQPTGRNRLSSPFPDFQDCQWLTIIAASAQWVLFNKSSCETKKDSGEQRAFAEEVHALVRHGWPSKFNALARATR